MAIPSCTITLSNSVLTTTQNATVFFTFSEEVSGFTAGDVTTPNATLGTISTTDNIIFTATLTPASAVLDNSNVITVTAGSYTSISTAEAGLAATSGNYTVNTVTLTINIADLTDGSGSLRGDGVFDVMMQAVKAHINDEFEMRRITSEQYPQVYLGALQSTMSNAVQFLLQKPIVERQALSEDAKKALIERQTKGFDDDAKQKLLKQMLDSWSVAYSVAQDANSIPDAIKVNPIDSVAKNAMDSLAIIKSNNPLGEA